MIVCIIWEKPIDKSLPQIGGDAASPRYMDGEIPAYAGMTAALPLWIADQVRNDGVGMHEAPAPLDTALKPV